MAIIIFKLVFQSGYFVCNEIITFKNRKLELIIYSIWSCVFITHVILVFLFDISIFRTAGLIPDEDSYIKSFGIPYLIPYVPFYKKEALKDGVIRQESSSSKIDKDYLKGNNK